MKFLKAGFAIAILTACAALLFLQHLAQEKLHAENHSLKQQISQLKTDNESLSNRLVSENNQINQISVEDQFRLREWHMINAMKTLCLAMRLFAEDHDKQYATNFNQLSAEFGPSDLIKDKFGNFAFAPDRINMNFFEFVNIGRVNTSTTNAIIFREKVPRVAPNGWWYRVYGLADGSVESVFGDEQGDEKKFTEYEMKHSVPQNQ
jgi:hypothetical protein